MEKTNYKEAGIYYLVGNLFNKGVAFLAMPIFSRILSTSDYGIATTYNSWVSILTIVVGLAIYMGLRAAFIDYKEKIDDFMSVVTTFTLVCGILTYIVVSLGMELFGFQVNRLMISLCLLQGLAAALIQNFSMYLMMQYQYKFRTALMIIPNFLSIVFSVVAILFLVKTDLYMGKIIPTAVINIVCAIMTVIWVYGKSHVLFNKGYLKYALAISAPLVLHGIALNILSQSDRTMITWLADSSQTGIYGLIYNFSMVATVITTSMEGIWVPWFTEKLKVHDTESINELAKDYIHLMTYAMIAVIFVGPEVVKIFAAKEYWEGIKIIPPVILANYFIFAYTLYVNIEHFHKKTPYITVNTLIAAGINLVLNYIFIPKYGYVAAAYTTLASYFVAFILHARYAKKLEPELYPLVFFMRSLVHIFVAVMVFYFFQEMWLIRWIIIIVYIALMALRERERIMEFFPSLQEKFRRKSMR